MDEQGKRPWYTKKIWWVIGVVVALVVVGSAVGASQSGDSTQSTAAAPGHTASAQESPPGGSAQAPEKQAVPSAQSTPPASASSKPAAEPPAPEMSKAQQNAVRSARNYLGYTAFSRSGLIKQLEFEGYSSNDAAFAVDKVAPDWDAQAAKAAEQYLDYSAFSRQGLIDQLTFDGYTQAQAAYGADQAGL